MVEDQVPQRLTDPPPEPTQSKPWSMLPINESLQNDYSIFPPINHENLHLVSNHNPEQEDLSPPSFSSTSASDSEVRVGGEVNRWFTIRLELLRAKMCRLASSLEVAMRWGSWLIIPGVGFAGVVILWWWLSRRRRFRRDCKDDWMLLVKEKDEKIMQLLHQIAQMNEVLLARHKLLTSKPGD